MANSVQQLQALGQSVWYDNMPRGLITSGELRRLMGLGISGLTSNPTIFEKAIAGSNDYDEALLKLAESDNSTEGIYETLVIEDIQTAADLLRPVFDRSKGADGFVSLEVSPRLAHNVDGTTKEARRLITALDRPNVMIKVPATPEGVSAIRQLIGEGININVTLIFSLDAYRQVREAYLAGLRELARSGGDLSRVSSVASFFVSRVDTAVDDLLGERLRSGNDELKSLLGKAAVANAKLAYRDFQEAFDSGPFSALREQGARVQRPLWASTGTKNPAYSDVLYVESLVSKDTVNTMPEATLTAFLEHGRAVVSIEADVESAESDLQRLEDAGILMEQVTARLLNDGLQSFADSYDKLLANIEEKRNRVLAGGHKHPGVSLGDHLSDVEVALADLQSRDVVARIWRKDHTVWKSDPTEISDRLGWLTVTDIMCERLDELTAFAQDVLEEGTRKVVLLGMGGSSLGPEVLRQTFGSAPGYPELIVLDTTVPEWVRDVSRSIDPLRTLFLVSSKSGSTVEPNVLYKHFRATVEDAVGREKAGRHFVAVTDTNTSLTDLAQREGFRRVFKNPPDLGGRYSVLSYFGLVPAALMGLDIAALLDRADCMREGCASCVAAHDNPGASLGAAMATLARNGRDKLTLLASPTIGSFGLWVEQLIAESTGKEGKGIVPVAGEPLLPADAYGDDRAFVYLRLEGDNDTETDAAVELLSTSGQPVIRLDLRDKYDLGAEFYRWEFATAVAGSLLGIHPFDQPNVQAAKDVAVNLMHQYKSSGLLPTAGATWSWPGLLSESGPGSYVAIMAYVQPTVEADRALQTLRRGISQRYGIATTLGYGPRFLHSTGQLHKGGPNSGLFLQLTTGHKNDIPIPGEAYTFGVLADAQAQGDLDALQTSGRRVSQVDLDSDVPAAIARLTAALA